MRAACVTTSTMPSRSIAPSSTVSLTVTPSAPARRPKNGIPAVKTFSRCVEIVMFTRLFAGTFISARRARMAVIASLISSIDSSSCGKASSSRQTGQSLAMMNLPSCGMACQISSVMNGMNGCSSRRIWSST